MIPSVGRFVREWLGLVAMGIFSVAIGEILVRIVTGRWTFLPAIRQDPFLYGAIIMIAAAVGLGVRRFRSTGAR